MIASVHGPVLELRSQSLVVRAGAFGVELLAPTPTLARCEVGREVTLHAHLVVREDSLTLYGFADRSSMQLFRALLGVGGVGPKVALGLLSTLAPSMIAEAVGREDAALLASAPGIGKRTAERIVMELRDKLPADLAQAAQGEPSAAPGAEDAIAALVALGYRESQVRSHVVTLSKGDPAASAEALIRAALAKLR